MPPLARYIRKLPLHRPTLSSRRVPATKDARVMPTIYYITTISLQTHTASHGIQRKDPLSQQVSALSVAARQAMHGGNRQAGHTCMVETD
jgi:hypothetical protein